MGTRLQSGRVSENRTPETKRQRKAPRTAFKPGQSGNPGGRPKALKDVQDLARKYTRRAVRALAETLRNTPDDKARIAAAEALLNRAWGKPQQSVELGGPGGDKLVIEVVSLAKGKPHA